MYVCVILLSVPLKHTQLKAEIKKLTMPGLRQGPVNATSPPIMRDFLDMCHGYDLEYVTLVRAMIELRITTLCEM